MGEYVSINVTDAEQLLQADTIRLKSWKGDYLHRTDATNEITTWETTIGSTWRACRGPGGTILLRSWKGDYLHRPDTPQGVSVGGPGAGNEWTLEPNGATFRLRSWKGDYLHRPDAPRGVTTWSSGIGNEWRVEAAPVQPVVGDLYTTMSAPVSDSFNFAAGSTFTQRFLSSQAGVPVELAVRTGINGRACRARMEIRVEDQVRFAHDFFDLTWRSSDGTSVFPILGFSGVVRADEWVSFSITPDRDLGIAVLNLNDPRCPPGQLAYFGAVTCGFSMHGAETAATGTYPVETVDPALIRSTMESVGTSYDIAAGTTFTQVFTAKGSGVPRELCVLMGNNQIPYGCRLTVSVRGAQVFERTYSNLVQRKSDWATVFSLDGIAANVQAGDPVAFTVTPDRQIRFGPLCFNEVGVQMSSLPGYGKCRAAFSMHA